MKEYNDNIGDRIWLYLNGHDIRLEIIVTEVDEHNRACRFKAAVPDSLWGSIGLLQEGDDWMIVEWDREMRKLGPQEISTN